MLDQKRKAIIVNKVPEIYKDAELSELMSISLPKDSEIEIGDVVGEHAVSVILADGQTGYLHGDQELNVIQPSWMAKDTTLYNRPDKTAQSRMVEKGKGFELLNIVEGTNNGWLRVRLPNHQIHYMKGNVRIQTEESIMESIGEMIGDGSTEDKILRTLTKQGAPEDKVRAFYNEITRLAAEYEQSPEGKAALRKKASNRILYGFLWVVGGIIATSVSYESASGGGSYSVFYGAIIWGVIDIIRGVVGVSKYAGQAES